MHLNVRVKVTHEHMSDNICRTNEPTNHGCVFSVVTEVHRHADC